MKVFEVMTEHMEGESKEIITTRAYVTTADEGLKTVVDYYTQHCSQYGEQLVGVREVLTIVRHLPRIKPEE